MVEKFLLDIPEQFKSERLILRSYHAGDGAWYYQMCERNREHLRRYESGNVIYMVKTPEQAEIMVRDMHADWVGRKHFFIGVFLKDSEEFAGNIYLGVVNWALPEYVLGYFADVGHEGQGYISEACQAVLKLAFGAMGAHRVRLGCSSTNERSVAVAQRLGFSQEGCLRQEKRNPEGGFDDTLIFGLLKEEFDPKG